MKNLSYLFWAYAVVWITLFGYMSTLGKRRKDLSRELEDLKSSLHKPEKHTL